ncbi:putative mitochondrial carrier protein [Rhizodiscina lignyota]|uniref:Mitochondrial thiamine pyrophosphate carrier 1 n=1 Tax=Rhizodiscina lignyota TaxID=1504668 RepID=A0A9P4I944_9PEZI|nr:putative mitochondrial carrier protein [Rhizodiscina lignyota]
MVPIRTKDRERAPAATRQKILDKKSWDYIVRSGLAGGIAGCAAKTVVGPLDRVKILFQASNPQFQKYTGSWSGVAMAMRDIYHGDGIRGLFRGHSATLLRVFPYAGIKFLAYEQIRTRIIPDRSYETPIRRFMSGSLAGMLSVFCTYPLEMVRVRMAFETKREGRSSLTRTIKKIYYEHPEPAMNSAAAIRGGNGNPLAATVAATSSTIHTVTPRYGVANFFRGFTATLCGMLPYAGASFLTHDTASDLLRHPAIVAYTTIPGTAGAAYSYNTDHESLKLLNKPSKRQATDPHKPPQLRSWAELSAGGFAGFVSQTVSYPLEVIRRRMQVGGVVGDGHRLGMTEVAAAIFRERGWKGFFVGLGIGYVKVIPMVATSFFVYERGKWALGI